MSVPFQPAGLRARRPADPGPRALGRVALSNPEHAQAIENSHERCHAIGLSRIERPDHSLVGRSDLGVARERNLRLYSHAAPVMEMLYEQIINTESMVVLTDVTGTILHSIGDDDFLSKASKVALQPGANWSESNKGTNAVGTALIDEVPTLVHADEHYMHANHFLTCSAAPILDPRGNILGVLDVSGDQRSYHQHTMALVKMSARMIENHWLSDDFRNMMRLHFHSRVEFIGTLMEGILAVSPDGKIVGANRSALEQLRVSGAALRMHSLDSLFGTAVGALADRFRSPLALPLPMTLGDGRTVHLRAQFNWPAWAPGGDAGASALARASRNAEDATMRLMGAHCERAADPAAGEGAAGDRLDHGRAAGVTAGVAAAGTGLRHLQTGDAQIDALTTKLRRVLNRDIPVLILGETGTGKELLARAFHHDSDRAGRPFVAVNCASIPETLIEAELFGYEEGAFTGARRKGATGKIVQASGGTLFLDEIGDMPLPLQAHLLRVLQERQVTPLGSSKSVSVDVAIVCATHRNLREMIDAKQFREDLYYRLNGLAVRLPALRERTDLQVLIQRILERQIPQRTPVLAPEVLQMFTACAWPGNVRQLFNVLRTAAVMCAGEPVITREHLSDDFVDEALRHAGGAAAIAPEPGRMPPSGGPAGPAEPVPRGATAPSRPLQDLEIEAIRRSVDQAGGNISEAAKQLGISRNTIYRKLRWRSG